MKTSIFLALFAGFTLSVSSYAGADFLAQQTVAIESNRSNEVLDLTVGDLKAIFLRYRPALDSSSKIVRPVRVSGSATNPIMEVSIQKCVGFICKTVDLDAAISIQEARGNCARNFILQADLSRSSALVRDIYDRLDVSICYQATAGGQGNLLLKASAHQAPQYSRGIMQNEMFKMLQLQVTPIVQAVRATLKDKSRKAR